MGRNVKIGVARDFFDRDGKFFIPGPGLKLLDDMGKVEWQMVADFRRVVTPDQISNFDMVIELIAGFKKESLNGNDRLISVHCNSVGFDHIDVDALTEAGIALCNTPIAIRHPVASSIIAFILNLSLRIPEKVRLAREGRWDERLNYMGVGLVGKTLGSIGIGGIGHEVFRLAKPFQMKHIACDPYVKQETVNDVEVKLVDMDTLLAESDFLNISCPLNKGTFHLVGEAELSKMKKTAFLINTSRGPVIDEAALIKALQEGWIRGAGIDVFEQEPTPRDNPLLTMENVITTPHAVCSTDEVWINKWAENIDQVTKIIRGEIPDAFVNREVWDNPVFQSKLERFRKEIS